MNRIHLPRRGGLVVALLAIISLGVVSRAFASSDMLLEIKDEKGKVTKVKVASDGSFTTPALKAGTYTFSWKLIQQPAGSARKVVAGTTSVNGASPTPAQVCVAYSIYSTQKGARDAASGMASGKRQHKPITIRASIDRSSPQLSSTFESITLDEDCDGLEGNVSFLSKDGKTMAVDDWSPRSN
jgi:hypothetical protein